MQLHSTVHRLADRTFDQRLRHAPPAVAKLRRRRTVRCRRGENAHLQRVVPEGIEVRAFLLPGKQLRAPELAHIRIVAGLLFAEPSEEALLRGEGVEER